MRILVCDDDEDLRELFADVLIKAGHEVETAKDGVEGLSMFRKAGVPFQAVVSDYQMPRSNGVLMLRAIHELEPGTLLVLVSADPPEQKQLPEGCRILKKPFRNEALRQAVLPQ